MAIKIIYPISGYFKICFNQRLNFLLKHANFKEISKNISLDFERGLKMIQNPGKKIFSKTKVHKKLENPIFHEKHDFENRFVADSEFFSGKKIHFTFQKNFSSK